MAKQQPDPPAEDAQEEPDKHAGGRPLTFDHFGKQLRLTSRRSVVRPIPRLAALDEPKQPPGRAPMRRGQERPRELRPRSARPVGDR